VSAVDDTDPRIEAFVIDGWRNMPAHEKLAKVRALNQAVQKLALVDIRRRYPSASEREVELRLASRWLDADLMRRAFGWDPESEGM
jgi:hypothetical protein